MNGKVRRYVRTCEHSITAVCSKYGMSFDIKFNTKKTVVMISRTKDDQKLTFPSFSLAGEVLEAVKKFKYQGQIISDDDDV